VFDDVKDVLSSVLQSYDAVEHLTAESPLLGAIPDMDSMAVVSILTALEENMVLSWMMMKLMPLFLKLLVHWLVLLNEK
jgi:hypothetical protein